MNEKDVHAMEIGISGIKNLGPSLRIYVSNLVTNYCILWLWLVLSASPELGSHIQHIVQLLFWFCRLYFC